MPVTSTPRRSREVSAARPASSVHASRQGPFRSPYSGVKWSNTQAPSNPADSANCTLSASSGQRSWCCATSRPIRISLPQYKAAAAAALTERSFGFGQSILLTGHCSEGIRQPGKEGNLNLRPALARSLARFLALAMLPASVAGITVVSASASKPVTPTSGCQLSGPVKHVIYLVFDNTHFLRDAPNVPSDLEQMPHLLNFLTSNGSLLTNDHTILISHTAGGILSSLTGLYPDRQGQTVSNSYFYFDPATHNPQFSTSFKYWTDLVDDSAGVKDPLPNMVFDGQKNTPAPWVPYTRAGCDFGGVSTANIELENIGTGPFGDMSEAFGTGSPEWTDAVASNAAPSGTAARAKAFTDYVGIAIHCANGGRICASSATNVANSRPDKLPDEPGDYVGYQALYGAKYVNQAIRPGVPAQPNNNVCLNDTSGAPVADPFGRCGFPGFDWALAKNTLGYVAQMQEAGVPVTYAYISDAHDNHTSSFPAPFNPSFPRASGPGEADYKAQLKAYDDAFAAFFDRLAGDGITKENTLFVVTADEGDHYAGGAGIAQPDGSAAYADTN